VDTLECRRFEGYVGEYGECERDWEEEWMKVDDAVFGYRSELFLLGYEGMIYLFYLL
jgi:hypothetical protein